MKKSQLVLILIIAGVLWFSKDYLYSKKDRLVSTWSDQKPTHSSEPLRRYND